MTQVGTEITRVMVTDLKRTQIVMYAGASGDYNPLHTDEPYATKIAGNPTVMAHGMITMGLAGRVLTDWFGHENILRYRARFKAPVWPGDTITVTAKVTGLAEVDGARHAELTLSAVNAVGAEVLSGTATARVPDGAAG
ncbi:MaoC-like dehydratase [Acrocarpospora phusangensis]|uniref:MaoC-like dehydratase n=1 Tax=Acrocarpospora phusangensis TaxID=1070424 RepID=A0A919UNB8_9ACTN|nr:MaoC/PaaZ C-terminal domain-containing protein [Acrocarpospora phusangensis]GIH22550.1 MaoC-like dehydratase [Acrocarpospora phusangensis]